MIHIQEYRPDTCTCVVQESWDDSVPEDQRVHTLEAVLHRGPEHASILDSSLYPVIREENRRKNLTVGKCVSVAAVVPGQISWAYTPGRLLQISFSGVNVPNATKQAIQAWCDTNLGVGKVVIL